MLERLFAARGLRSGEWWPFLVQEEGTPLPGGLEALSGFVLTRSGDVYGWWLDWAPADAGLAADEGLATGRTGSGGIETGAPGAPQGRYVLDRWWRVAAPEREFAADAEYRGARERLGLP